MAAAQSVKVDDGKMRHNRPVMTKVAPKVISTFIGLRS